MGKENVRMQECLSVAEAYRFHEAHLGSTENGSQEEKKALKKHTVLLTIGTNFILWPLDELTESLCESIRRRFILFRHRCVQTKRGNGVDKRLLNPISRGLPCHGLKAVQ